MPKKIYEVRGNLVIEVVKRVKAHDEDEAIDLAERLFSGLESYCGNGGIDKLIGVSEDSESVEDVGNCVVWTEAYETDDDRYDEETEDEECTYICKLCGEVFHCENERDFDSNVEEELWGHLQTDHEEEFEECQDWDTPYMIDEYFDVEEN